MGANIIYCQEYKLLQSGSGTYLEYRTIGAHILVVGDDSSNAKTSQRRLSSISY